MTSMQPQTGQRLTGDGGPSPTWSLDGVRAGAAIMVPALPGVAVFGMAFGALASQKGLTLFEALVMSGVVFAGVSQIASMEIWSQAITPVLIATLAFTTLVINLRMILMGGSMQPWLGTAPAVQAYSSLYILTDSNWVASLRYRREGGADVGYLFGGGLIVWLTFVPSTGIGQVFGSLLRDPRPFGIDLILPLYFVALLAPMFETLRRSIPWAIAGAVAVTVQHFVPGFWYIIAGTLAGAIAGGFFGDE
ncbi:MAG: AzlC family ABC transporter permease [Pseudorhodoplanes sp.]